MAGNTIMTAKNSFSEGLLMDFSPDNTQANCMTSALNATLLTFNGNEMSLQNDMGNGRVETAYLPEGYIPVGTCEFGDIIYIISYNPLTDKAQIGCFPSPERNISSEELTNAPNESVLRASDFQELDDKEEPTGKLKTSSVKKVLFQNDLHPGDKYIIASDELYESRDFISAYGSTKYNFDDFPKFVKIHVVSIEESGKINYLDSSVRWYDSKITDNDGIKNIPYFISKGTSQNLEGKLDIDSYRNLVSSEYSVFNSKASGQLALLIELEKITGFSCTWECYKKTPTQTKSTQKRNYDTIYPDNFDDERVDGEGGSPDEIIPLPDGTLPLPDRPGFPNVNEGGNTTEEGEGEGEGEENGNEGGNEENNNQGNTESLEYTDYSVYLNFNWTTNHNDINPFKIILEESDWQNGKYKYWKTGTDVLSLEYDGKMDKDSLPNITEFDISRHYCPEDNITYNKYNTEYKYDKVIEKYDYSKIVRIDENGIPTSKYAMNCDKVELNANKNELLYKTLNEGLYENCTIFDNESSPEIPDSIINNKFKYPITKYLGDFKIPTHTNVQNTYKYNDEYGNPVIDTNNQQKTEIINEKKKNDIKNLIYHYKVIPTMPYGKLEEFSQEGYIDFSKIGTEFIKLHTWKYYGYENTMTLNWGLDAYTDPGKIITDVQFEFYSDEGLIARITHPSYTSYNGSFTDYIVLNKKYGNGNILDTKSDGTPISSSNEKIGILKSNSLYLVKIIITQGIQQITKDVIPIQNEKIEYRWIWTNSIFNDHYYNVQDFDNLNLTLDLDCDTNFTQNVNCWKSTNSLLENPENTPITDSNIQNSLSAKVQQISSDVTSSTDRNVTMRTYIKLKNNHGIFDLDLEKDNFKIYISEGSESLTNIPERPKILFSQQELEGNDMIYPVYNTNKFIGTPTSTNNKIYSGLDVYKEYYNTASLVFPSAYYPPGYTISEEPLKYVDFEGNYIETKAREINLTWQNLKLKTSDGKGIQLGMCFNATHYSKYYYYTGVSEYDSYIVRPCLRDSSDFSKYNLIQQNGSINFRTFYYAGVVRTNSNDGDNDHMKIDYGTFELNPPSGTNLIETPKAETLKSNVYDLGKDGPHGEYITTVYEANKNLLSDINLFFPFTLGVDYTKHNSPDMINEYIGSRKKLYIENDNDAAGKTGIPRAGDNTLITNSNRLPYTINTKSNNYDRDSENFKNIQIYTLGYKYKDGIKIMNMWRDKSDGTTKNIDLVLALLTQIYYKTSDQKLYTNNYKQNYAYLEDNYMLYSRDIVVKIAHEGTDSLIKFNNSTISTYVKNVKEKAKNPSGISSYNITPMFNSCIKSFPVQFKIYYQPPTFESKPESGGSVVQSCYNDIPKLIQQDLLPNVPYVFNGEKFVNISSVDSLYLIDNLTFNSDSLLKCNVDLFNNNGASRTKKISLNHINSYFTIENDTLKFTGVPESTSNYYDLITTASSQGKNFWGKQKDPKDTGLIRFTQCNDLFQVTG